MGSTNRRILVQTNLGINQRPHPQITKAKRTGVVAQAVECRLTSIQIFSEPMFLQNMSKIFIF
jgi:hypothetical protein